MISFIVSVYDRTAMLNACLATLVVQGHTGEIIVCCNSTEPGKVNACAQVTARYDCYSREDGHTIQAGIEATGLRGAKTCYESAAMVSPYHDWICFPSDDSLYVQGFSRIMLEAAERTGADLVYCDCVYAVGSENNPAWRQYSVLSTEPRMSRIDKTCFILRRELFKSFPPHPKGWCDGALIEQLVAQGVRHAKAPGVLVVHQ